MSEENRRNMQSNDADILPPDFSIKRKIGMDVNLNQIFTAERIAAAQKTIDDTQADYVQWAMQDVSQLDDLCLLYTSPSPRDRTRSRMPSSA